MGSTKRSKAAATAAANEPTSATVPLAETTNTPAVLKARANGRAKKYTQADMDARTAQFEADLAAIAAQAQADHQAEVADLQRRLANAQQIADDAAREANRDSSLDDSIPRPYGSAGDGFRLIDAMGLTDHKLEYDMIRRKVHKLCARVKLPMEITFRKQADRKIVHLCDKMREECPFMRRFVGDWATKELARQYLKHVRAYERKKRLAMLAELPFGNDDEAGSGAEA